MCVTLNWHFKKNQRFPHLPLNGKSHPKYQGLLLLAENGAGMAMGRRRGRGDGRRAAGGRQGGRRPASGCSSPGAQLRGNAEGRKQRPGEGRKQQRRESTTRREGRAQGQAGSGAALPARRAPRSHTNPRQRRLHRGEARGGRLSPRGGNTFPSPRGTGSARRLLPQLRCPAFSGRPGPFPAGRAPSPP